MLSKLSRLVENSVNGDDGNMTDDENDSSHCIKDKDEKSSKNKMKKSWGWWNS